MVRGRCTLALTVGLSPSLRVNSKDWGDEELLLTGCVTEGQCRGGERGEEWRAG